MEKNKTEICVFWFRRDLRLDDNHGLFQALSSGVPVLPIFIFDTDILIDLEKNDARVEFIHKELDNIHQQLGRISSGICVYYGTPGEVWEKISNEWNIKNVYTNHDYEPYAQKRDEEIKKLLLKKSIEFFSFKDQVIFEKEEVVKDDGKPYTIFTPYSKKWRKNLTEDHSKPFQSGELKSNFLKYAAPVFPSLESIGFVSSGLLVPSKKTPINIIRGYEKTRDVPSLNGTSRLGIHLRFGTIGIRTLLKEVIQQNEVFVTELIWREFFMMILWHFPQVTDRPFHAKYEGIRWRNNEEDFEKWKNGMTGFPIVDAGMRELAETGHMHNRVRMIAASFLVKDLLIDWRWGEAWFAEKLLDYELASNNGNWQWAAGTGCDAAPYFRIFNPESQMKKFDPKAIYIRKWIPEYGTAEYPQPMVNHAEARLRCLEVYKEAVKNYSS